MDLSSSAVLLGSALSLTSKILTNTGQPITEHVHFIANFFGLYPNTKNLAAENKSSTVVIGRCTIHSLATAERDCTLPDPALKGRPGFL